MLMEGDEIKRLNCLLDIYIDVNLERYFSVLSNQADPFLIVNMSGNLVYVNEHCEALLRCSKNELEQKSLSHLFIPAYINESQSGAAGSGSRPYGISGFII